MTVKIPPKTSRLKSLLKETPALTSGLDVFGGIS